jgi:hypothetical protein
MTFESNTPDADKFQKLVTIANRVAAEFNGVAQHMRADVICAAPCVAAFRV